MHLSVAELASIWCPPLASMGDRVERILARWLPVPAPAFVDATNPRMLPLGLGQKSDGSWVPIGMDYADLRYVMHITAPMGRGKSEWLKSLFTGLLNAGAGFMALDCKGTDLVNGTLPLIPRHREGDVVILDLGGTDVTGERLAPAMNLLSPAFGRSLGLDASKLASTVLQIFATLDPRFNESVGIKQFANMGMLALAEGEPRATLMHLIRFFGDADYRNEVTGRVRNQQVKDFWERRFAAMPDGQKSSLASFERRLDELLTYPEIASMMVAPGCSIDMRKLMDSNGILLAGIKASEGQIAALAATILLIQLMLAALSRTNVPENRRPDWPVVIDEVQIIAKANEDLAKIMLSQFRAFRIGQVWVHQGLSQLGPGVMGPLGDNAQSRLILGAELTDASSYAANYNALGLTKDDFVQMERFEHQYIKLYGRGSLFSSRMPPLVQPLQEDMPTPCYTNWRTVTAPAESRREARLDQAIAMFAEHALVDRDQAVARLGSLSDDLFEAYCLRTAAHRRAQRDFILANPGCIAIDPRLPEREQAIQQKETRIRLLAALKAGVPRLETEALQWKLLMAARAAAERQAEAEAAEAAAKKQARSKGKGQGASAGTNAPAPVPVAPMPVPMGARPDASAPLPSLGDLVAARLQTRVARRDDSAIVAGIEDL